MTFFTSLINNFNTDSVMKIHHAFFDKETKVSVKLSYSEHTEAKLCYYSLLGFHAVTCWTPFQCCHLSGKKRCMVTLSDLI